MIINSKTGCLLFDWGDTLMTDYSSTFQGPMYKWPKVNAIEHAEEILSKLKEKWIIAVATNAKDSEESDIRKAFERVNLSKYIDKIYCFKSVGFAKPSNEFFGYILKDLSACQSNIIMIGDDYEKDIIGANDSGIFGIWFNTKTNEVINSENCITIKSLLKLPEVLNKIKRDN